MYFPTEKMIYKDARDREIVSEYNGFNHKELAAKYNMSESYIRAIINRHKKRTSLRKFFFMPIYGYRSVQLRSGRYAFPAPSRY